ncbi:MAG: YbdD/YjiX family protein [Pseudomonadota bacterium]
MSRSTPFAERARALWRLLAQTARLIVGVPDYDLYLAHMRRMHPDTPPMTREAFFVNRLEARYGRGASRCC